MKSEIVESPIEKKEIKFPLAAKATKNGTIVLFTDTTTGTVLFSGDNSDKLGDYKEHWITVNSTGTWQILDSVTITFES